MVYAASRSTFDGVSLETFLQDLDTVLYNPKSSRVDKYYVGSTPVATGTAVRSKRSIMVDV